LPPPIAALTARYCTALNNREKGPKSSGLNSPHEIFHGGYLFYNFD